MFQGDNQMMYTFSGIDSSGKTTQIELLKKYCEENNIPYYYKWGKGRATPVVMWLKKVFRRDNKMNDEEKKEYREQIYQNKKKKFLLLILSILDVCWFWGVLYRYLKNRHKILICDRYVWDTFIDFKTEFSEFNMEKWLIWRFAKFVAPKQTVLFCSVFLQRNHLEETR
jgi:thymidylate kinase